MQSRFAGPIVCGAVRVGHADAAGELMLLRHVLVVDELQGGPQLLRDAAILAEAADGHVRLVCRVDGLADGPHAAAERRAVVARLEERAAVLRSRGVRVTTGVIVPDRFESIVREAVRARSDIVLKWREPCGRVEALVRGDGDRLLLRNSPCPVWLVHEESSTAGPVLAAVNPQEHDGPGAALDGRILETASAIADGLRVSLHVVHAWSAPLMPLLGRVGVDRQRNRRVIEEGAAAAAAAAERCLARAGLPVPRRRIHLVRGDPRAVLPDVADSIGAQVLVAGEMARRRVGAAVQPNVAEHVLSALRCSLLVVRSEPAGEPTRARARAFPRLRPADS